MNIKHYLFLLTHLVFTAPIFSNDTNALSFAQRAQTDPKNIVIVFDIDDVLVKPERTYDFAKLLWTGFTSDIGRTFQFRKTKQPSYTRTAWACLKDRIAIEKFAKTHMEWQTVDFIADQYPLIFRTLFLEKKGITLADNVKTILFQAKPINKMINLMMRLQQRGYSIALATNRSKQSVDYLIKNKLLPDYCHYAFIMTPDATMTSNLSNDPYAKVAKKPNAHYYETLKNLAHQSNPSLIEMILIDDQLKYCEAAEEENITSIHFKSAKKLERDLRALGITL